MIAYLYLNIDGRRVQIGREFAVRDAWGIEGLSGENAARELERMRRGDMARASRKYVKAKWGVEDESISGGQAS